MTPAERLALFARRVSDLEDLEARLRAEEGAEDLSSDLVAAALAVVAAAPSWAESVEGRAALGLGPFSGGPETFAAYLEAVRGLALHATPEGLVQ